MNFVITTETPVKFKISADRPECIEVGNGDTVRITVSIVRDGKSAYESAVENGFIGTEPEWLNLIQNPDGGIIF